MGTKRERILVQEQAEAYIKLAGLDPVCLLYIEAKRRKFFHSNGFYITDIQNLIKTQNPAITDEQLPDVELVLSPEQKELARLEKNKCGNGQGRTKAGFNTIEYAIKKSARKAEREKKKQLSISEDDEAMIAPEFPAPLLPQDDVMLNDRMGLGSMMKELNPGSTVTSNAPLTRRFEESQKKRVAEVPAFATEEQKAEPVPASANSSVPDPLPGLRFSLDTEDPRCKHCGNKLKK